MLILANTHLTPDHLRPMKMKYKYIYGKRTVDTPLWEIYAISRKGENKQYFYIGQHKVKSLDNSYYGSGKRVINSIKKYGKDQHQKQVITYAFSQKEADYLEEHFIEALMNKTTVECMNLTIKPKRPIKVDIKGKNNPMYGKHHSPETRKKISEIRKQQIMDGMPVNFKGKHHTEETRKLISEKNKKPCPKLKGRIFSPEHLRKLSEANKGLKRFTDGTNNVTCKECPEGYWRGVTRRR